jgi:hypothetical protein
VSTAWFKKLLLLLFHQGYISTSLAVLLGGKKGLFSNATRNTKGKNVE